MFDTAGYFTNRYFFNDYFVEKYWPLVAVPVILAYMTARLVVYGWSVVLEIE